MDALLTAFLCAFLAAWGDKTQLMVAMLAGKSGRPGRILIGLLIAAVASNVVAAILGMVVAPMITIRAMTLLTALALLFGGASGLLRRKPPADDVPVRWPILTAIILCLAAEMGDRIQFFTFALAGRFHSVPLAAAGATAGLLAACLPAALLGPGFAPRLHIGAARYAVAALFLIAGFITAVNALQLTG
jgi:Ca2+/H+ antiporter, TMEM165/GDT1 family